jgi:hypothetical protein
MNQDASEPRREKPETNAMEPDEQGIRPPGRINFHPAAFAAALLRDAGRRPAPWLAAGAVGSFLLGAALALPSTGGADRVRLTASHVAGAIFLLASAGAVLLPSAFFTREKQEAIFTGWSAFPRGAASAFTGSFLASVALLLAWVAFLLGLGALVLFFAVSASDGEPNPLVPRREFRAEPGEARTLEPGDSVRYTLPALPPSECRGATVAGFVDVRLHLARPDAAEFGAPLTLVLLDDEGGGSIPLVSGAPIHSRSVPFRIPSARAASGGRLELRFGSSPFNVRIPPGGVRLLGAERSPWCNYLLAGLSILLASLLLATFAAAGATFLSLPVAVFLAVGIALAGYLTGPAAEAMEAWQRMGLMKAKEGVPDLPVWFEAFRVLLRGMIAALPDLGSMNRAGDLAQGREIPAGALLRDLLRIAAYGVPTILIGSWIAWRREPG